MNMCTKVQSHIQLLRYFTKNLKCLVLLLVTPEGKSGDYDSH